MSTTCRPAAVPEASVARQKLLKATTWTSIGVVASLIAIMFYDVVPSMVADWWHDEGSSQGFLILPLALYLTWQHRHEIRAQLAAGDTRGIFLTLAACLVYLAGKLGAEFFLTRVSLIILIASLVWTFWGLRRLRSLAFPLLLLATMVPPPTLLYNQVAAPLQLLASACSTWIAGLFGVVTFREGNIIHLAHSTLGVAEACSGLRSLSSLVIASLLIGYVYHVGLRGQAILFALATPIAVLVNVVRVSGTAVLADYDADLALGFYHTFAGWLVFVGGFGILIATAKLVKHVCGRIEPSEEG